ncbi:MAG: TetR/AcrR family transcriptional regulator [Clostridiales bacterium]|nr:TetR/AcrR family transcriptional regulator [Clostridiales bacterium]
MNEKFFDLKKEKQDRMINAALKVFAENGYRHASTDDIVAEAGISKGLLFHYFISKLGLYEFLYDYSVRFMTLELTTRVNKNENDFFVLLKQVEAAKIHVLKNYPYMQQFIDSTKYENVKEALIAAEEKKNTLKEAREAILNQADLSRFKPEADPAKLLCMIEYAIQGMMKESFFEGSFHPDMINEEINGYLDMMKQLAYK